MFSFAHTSHSYLLGKLCGQSSINETLYRRMVNFIYALLFSSNDIVAYVGRLAMLSAMTSLGCNISYCRSTFGIDFERSRKISMHLLNNAHCLSTEQLNKAAIAVELNDMYDVSLN